MTVCGSLPKGGVLVRAAYVAKPLIIAAITRNKDAFVRHERLRSVENFRDEKNFIASVRGPGIQAEGFSFTLSFTEIGGFSVVSSVKALLVCASSISCPLMGVA